MHKMTAWWRKKTILGAIVTIILAFVVLLFGRPATSALTNVVRWEPETDPLGAPVASETLDDLFAPPISDDEPAPDRTAAPEQVVVYISGAVVQPDVYMLSGDARVKDVVVAAGGLTADAASDQINLAATITDAQHIRIPRIGEAAQTSNGSEASTNQSNSSHPDLIDLNTAGAAELEDLPGIGQTLAERIIEYRVANGPFTSIQDLRKVSGIGDKLFQEIHDRLTIGG